MRHTAPAPAIHTLCPPPCRPNLLQSEDPGTDFRGAGYFGLENLVYLAERHPHVFKSMMLKLEGTRVEWEYPFAAAGLNLTYMLSELLELHGSSSSLSLSESCPVPKCRPGRAFLVLLAQDECAFEELYCLTFQQLDKVWLDTKASYMEFGQVGRGHVGGGQGARGDWGPRHPGLDTWKPSGQILARSMGAIMEGGGTF